MSPRRANPLTKSAVIDIGARLLAEEGPQSLSTRRIAAEVGSSTTVVYTNFGGMSGLVREMVHEGFARLQLHLAKVAVTGDPVGDMAVLGRAYRHNALINPHLYGVMFGGASLAGFELSEGDRQHGRYNLTSVQECAGRCIGEHRFQPADPVLVANQMWIVVHGLVALELGGYLTEPFDAAVCFEAQLVCLMRGMGDDPDSAARSVGDSAARFEQEVLAAREFPAAASG
jgi:AcrR family transcriptional regulator